MKKYLDLVFVEEHIYIYMFILEELDIIKVTQRQVLEKGRVQVRPKTSANSIPEPPNPEPTPSTLNVGFAFRV